MTKPNLARMTVVQTTLYSQSFPRYVFVAKKMGPLYGARVGQHNSSPLSVAVISFSVTTPVAFVRKFLELGLLPAAPPVLVL